MIRSSAVSAFVLAACMAAGLASAPAAAQSSTGQATPETFRTIVTARNESIVIIKFILKGDDSSGGDEEQEVFGTMIDGKGLVLVSNYDMGGMAARFGGGAAPSEIKVLVGDDTKGVEAKLVARDTEMDLAWVQIDTPPEKPYTFLDLAQAGNGPQIGDFLYTVTRSGKFYDRTPIGREIRVVGHATKPRDLVLVGSDTFNGFGMPVYNAENKCVGITALILPSEEEMQNARELFGEYPPIAILPIKDVAKATEQARETAANAKAEQPKETAKEEPKSGPTPDAAPADTAKPATP